MNREAQPRFQPLSRLLRTVFLAVAVLATLATGELIDVLARGHGMATPQAVQAAYFVATGSRAM